MLRLYFGHPINVYGTDLECRLLECIARELPRWDVENPNQKHHQEGYRQYARDYGKGMTYYFERVLPQCHGGIFLPFADGAWGKGVAGEAQWLFNKNLPIWKIDHLGAVTHLTSLKSVRILTVEETRVRIRKPSGELIPY
ncbi:MAG: hypothetical protein KGI60_02845 [Patescibacteria group bacterium]|nr:hypothetical protein [Patescibacteria group bacterium]